MVASPELLSEYDYVLGYPEITRRIEPELLRAYRSHLFQEIELISLSAIPRICRDPDDDKVIATAIVGQVDFLVTEDGDLQTRAVRAVLAESGVDVTTMRELMTHLDRLTE